MQGNRAYEVYSEGSERGSKSISALMDYLTSIAEPGGRVQNARFDMLDVTDEIPILVLIDVVNNGDDFIMRYLGAGNVGQIGPDLTGYSVNDIENVLFRDNTIEILKLVIAKKQAVVNGPNTHENSEGRTYELRSVAAPLFALSGEVERIVSIVDCTWLT